MDERPYEYQHRQLNRVDIIERASQYGTIMLGEMIDLHDHEVVELLREKAEQWGLDERVVLDACAINSIRLRSIERAKQ